MSDEEKERIHRLRSDFTTLAEAAMLAYVRTLGGRADTTVPDALLNAMATRVACLLTVYSMSEDWTAVRALAPDEVGLGVIGDGGRVISYKDGRPSITRLVVTHTSLKAALETF